jgi:hypothetical protein
VRFWEGWLDRGYRVSATGGSDNHWVSTQAVQGVGQPTTWAFVTERSRRGIVEAIRSGRTFISHQPPSVGGPRLYLEADEDADGTFEAMVGDAVAPGSALRVRVENAPGSMLRVFTDEGTLAFEPVPVTGTAFEHAFSLPADATWARAEIFDPDLQEQRKSCDGDLGGQTTYCRNNLLILAMTSALYFEEQTAPAQLTLEAPASGRVTDDVDIVARLTSDGEPLGDRPVVLELGSKEIAAMTDRDGIASARLMLEDPPGEYRVSATFAGDQDHSAAEAEAPFTIEHEVTELRYDGQTSAKGDTVEVAAVLTEDDGPVVAGRTVTFELAGSSAVAVTDSTGRAATTMFVPDHGRTQNVVASFAGDDIYSLSSTEATVGWGRGHGLTAAPTAPAPAVAPAAARDPLLPGLGAALAALVCFGVSLGALRRAVASRRKPV